MLNRNLELVNSLGKDFDQMSHLWSGFRQVFLEKEGTEVEDMEDVTVSEMSP
ncbi:hypothetical protein K493DRAFT_318646 [Basidiobolus meristosporus CBS 931.73]|uniref:Outer kinetochore protein DAD1 n=1 Tax=Basidiobolus meristosporus CBS 931.73 TaxID=1314790 RepID=A0A1Y1XVJ8_9FUNG|nr:hypothetical protein K493DRAFT_318646 [Basidiobolus meristosporus CBS 931.73]|eukprot:ORX89506.1 hypothetical protein K493DRAFT_318646 [Basidiobolus meristosporus CBS 931.73]